MDDPIARARAIAARLSASTDTSSTEPVRKKSRWGDDQAPTPSSTTSAQSALQLALGGGNSQVPVAASPRLSASAAVAAAMMVGMTQKSKKKIYIPQGGEFGDIDFRKLLIGPRGSTQKAMEEKFGTKILIRGRGSTKDGSVGYGEDDNDDLHVCVEGEIDKVEAAAAELERIMSSPEAAQALKADQLNSLALLNNGGSGGGGGQYGGGGGGGGDGGHYGPSGGGGKTTGLGFGGYDGEETSDSVEIPNAQVGLVIGKGGETIQSIIRASGCHVQIAKEHEMLPGAATRSVFLRGSLASIEKAKAEIDRRLTERSQGGARTSGSAYGPGSGGEASVTVKIPNAQVGLIIGKGGVTVKGIQERTGTNCQIPQGPDQDDMNMRTITVVGSSEQGCHAAVSEINDLIAERMNNMNGGGQRQGQNDGAPPNILVIKNEFAGAVIGKGGTIIRSIQERTGARVQIPSNADMGGLVPSRSLTITGTREAQERAVREITEAIYSHGGPGGTPVSRDISISPEPVGYGGGGGYGQAGYDNNMYNDPYMMYQQQQQQQAYYAQQQQLQQQQQQPQTEGAVDMTAYYNDFWQYYAAYGEKLAREYYGEWSPPVGTTPPDGIVAPPSSTDVPTEVADKVDSGDGIPAPPPLEDDAPPPPPPAPE